MPIDPTDVAGRRIAAWLIDAVIYVIVSNILSALLGINPKSHEVGIGELGGQTPTVFCNAVQNFPSTVCVPGQDSAVIISHWLGTVWLFLALAVLYIVIQGALGASVGKLALGLRVVRSDGTQAGIGASALRTVLWVVDAFTCALPILGGILILSTKGHRRVGDMAANTYVVPVAFVGRPVTLPGMPGWSGYPGQPVPGQTTPWAPTQSVGDGPWIRPPESQISSTQHDAPTSGFKPDVPIWDHDRNAYIQYDTNHAAWLEFDDHTKQWKPISQ